MFVPYVPFDDRRKPKLKDVYAALSVLLVAGFIACLVLADPHHHYATAFINAAAQWLHAAFPQLIK